MKKDYLEELETLKNLADEISNTPMMALAKIDMLVILNMRYERIMVNRNLDKHPYALVRDLIRDAHTMLSSWHEISFVENSHSRVFEKPEMEMEMLHKELFQKLWVDFSVEEYEQRIQRYVHRLRINRLGDGWLKGFKCIDFGCGHGNFAHALIREGAAYVYAIDFGEDSIKYAIKVRDRLGVEPKQIEFKEESVYKVSIESSTFDFAIQNGVFHHLENEDVAYREVRRVLKLGGWFWVYTDGSGAISHDLWDASSYILREIPHEFIISRLRNLNIETSKRYHLGDGLNATYRHATWSELTERLSQMGFGNFRRLVGGYPTDFDLDVIEADSYGKEKFGEGDLRILAQLVEK